MALKRIVLRDFVIVPTLDLELSHGFTVLTGETGAGKSILIDALQLALGARAEAGVVREGASSTEICVEFDTTASLQPVLQEAGVGEAQDGLLLRRTVDLHGRSKAWINGVPVSLTQVRAVADHLIDIHGQHAWQSLTRADSARELLDGYAEIEMRPLKLAWSHWQTTRKALAQARAHQGEAERRYEQLQWQIAEVAKLAPAVDEWDEINAQHTRLSHAQTLLESAQSALHLVEDESEGAARPLVKALSVLRGSEHIEPEFGAFAELLAACESQLDDLRRSLHAYVRHTDLDPESLAALDGRIASWMQLAKKYKCLPVDLPGLFQDWIRELDGLGTAIDLTALEASVNEAQKAYMEVARQVSRQRHLTAPRLAKVVTEAMQGLGMQGGHFEVVLASQAEETAAGIDTVEFKVAGHPGVAAKAIAKVASGGELSRLALALAVTISELSNVDCLIFDEVDSGIGGAVADTVGRLLRELGKRRQVLAVTHLPQVAASANHHLQVSKMRAIDSTISVVQVLDTEQRAAELARMLGGEKISELTVAHARELLGQVDQPSQQELVSHVKVAKKSRSDKTVR